MTTPTTYTPYHPRWYRRRVSVWWWLGKFAYAKFVLRELSSLAVAYFAVILLWKMRTFAAGPEAYARFLARMHSPLFLMLDSVAIVFVLYHSITWFNLAPKAIVIRTAGKRLPDWAIQGMNYLAWVVLSLVLMWLALRG